MAMFDIDPFLELALTMLLMNENKNKYTHDVNDWKAHAATQAKETAMETLRQ